MTVVLDLCDLNISVNGIDSKPSAQHLIAHPGYAYIENQNAPILGLDAVAQARLHPTRTNNRFWSELNTEPNGSSHAKVRHNADLVWHHLKQLTADTSDRDFILCVPSSYTEPNLKLLAGICHSLDITVKAFVNRAVAVCLEEQTEKSAVYVELQQHQTLLTFIERTENNNRGVEITKTGLERLTGQGLVRLQNRLLHIVQQRFIASSRFDPMHSGDTEQQLFSQLYQQTSANQPSGSFRFAVSQDQQQYLEQFSEDEFASAYQELVSEIKTKAQGLPLIFDSYFGGIPGATLHSDHLLAAKGSLLAGTNKICANLPEQSEDIAHFESAAVTKNSDAQHSNSPANLSSEHRPSEKTSAQKASHILLDGIAYPASNYRIEVNSGALDLKLELAEEMAHLRNVEGTLVVGEKPGQLGLNNEAAPAGKQLFPGDCLSMQGSDQQLMAIAIRQTES